MRNKIQILGNLYSKMGVWASKFNRGDAIKEHIRMLDWVLNPVGVIRDIGAIMRDEDYKLTPEEYIKKYSKG